MRRWARFTAADDRAATELIGGVRELVTAGQAEDARLHLLTGLSRAIGGVSALCCTMRTERAEHVVVAHQTMQPILIGLDGWQLETWRQTFIENPGFITHPMSAVFFREAGVLRSYRRRDLVSDRDWRRSDHADWLGKLGMDEVIAGCLPVASSLEVMIALTRETGDPSHSDRDRTFLLRVLGSLGWCYQSILDQVAGGRRILTRSEIAQRLPQRHQGVLRKLLTGGAEKQIAFELGLSQNTTHKYIEQVYRAFHVSSRAELMALWIDQA